MRLHILSDLHLYNDIRKPQAAADVTVLAGDVWDGGFKGIAWAAKTWTDRPVILVPGNHEFFGTEYNEHRAKMAEAAARHPNVHLLDRGAIAIGDVAFVGCTLWTDFWYTAPDGDAIERWLTIKTAAEHMPDYTEIRISGQDVGREKDILGRDAALAEAANFMPDYREITVAGRRLRPEDTAEIFKIEHAFLREVLSLDNAALAERLGVPTIRKKIAVTHHLPSARSVHSQHARSRVVAAYASRIDSTVELADLWCHGHTHDSCDYQIKAPDGHVTRVVCNPRGYSSPRMTGNSRYRPGFVVEI